MSGVYKILQLANGYYKIGYKNQGVILIYRGDNNLENVDVDSLNLADRNNFEIGIEIIDDYDLHISSNRKEGSRFKRVSIGDLGDLTIHRP